MKINHNKKRNTALIYEIMVKELTKASIQKDDVSKRKIVSLLREFFSVGSPLKKELEIYKTFLDKETLDAPMAEKMITEAKKQYHDLNRKQVFNEQTRLISKVNKHLSKDVWKNFVPSFKKLATINQVLRSSSAPKKQIMLEHSLLSSMTSPKREQRDSFPKINNLAIRRFLEKFNEEYSSKLTESQTKFLNKYVLSYMDNGLEFKTYLYEEIDRLKSVLSENVTNHDVDTRGKINQVIERVSSYNERKLDKKLMLEIFQIQALTSELNKDGNND